MLAGLFLLSFGAGCDDSPQARVQQALQATQAAGVFHGTALVRHGETVLWAEAVGEAAPGQPNTGDTRYRLASLTKLFTQAVVLRLVQSGQLAWEEPVVSYRPLLEKAIGPQVTVKQLFTMTAGLPREFPTDEASGVALDAEGRGGPFLDGMVGLQTGEVGVYQYSNVSYWLLGAVVEAVTRQPFSVAVQTHVLDPLGMDKAGFETPTEAPADLATGWAESAAGERILAPPLAVATRYASGGAFATAGDLEAFCDGLRDTTFLSLPQRALLTGSSNPDSTSAVQHQRVEAGGVLPGYTNRFVCDIETGDLIILLNNKTITPPSRLLDLSNELMAALGQNVPARPRQVIVFEGLHKGLPDTPLAHAMQKWMEAVASGDPDQVEAVLREITLPGEFKAADFEVLRELAALPEKMGGRFQFEGYREVTALHFEGLAIGEGNREVIFTFIATEAAPTLVKDLGTWLRGDF